MKEHQELPVTRFPSLPERIFQPDGFPPYQFLSMFFRILVPAQHFSGKTVDQERPFESEAFGPYQGILSISRKIILEEEQFPGIFRIQHICFLGFPEHIMISPDEDLPAWKTGDENQILPALEQFPAPGMIPYQHQGVLRFDQILAVFPDFFFVADPDGPHGVHGFLRPLKSQMKIPQRKKCHLFHPLFLLQFHQFIRSCPQPDLFSVFQGSGPVYPGITV